MKKTGRDTTFFPLFQGIFNFITLTTRTPFFPTSKRKREHTLLYREVCKHDNSIVFLKRRNSILLDILTIYVENKLSLDYPVPDTTRVLYIDGEIFIWKVFRNTKEWVASSIPLLFGGEIKTVFFDEISSKVPFQEKNINDAISSLRDFLIVFQEVEPRLSDSDVEILKDQIPDLLKTNV